MSSIGKGQILSHQEPKPALLSKGRSYDLFRLRKKQATSDTNTGYNCDFQETKVEKKQIEPLPLSSPQRHMAQLLRSSRDKRSSVAGVYFFLASLGKLIFGLGASLAVKGHFGHDRSTLIAGCVCIGIGFVCVVLVALGFSAALHKIDRTFAIFLKCVSIGGAMIIAGGYASNQYFVSTKQPLLDVRLSFLPLMIGSSMLVFSITNFAAYTELVRGRMYGLPLRHRNIIALCCLAVAIGILFAGWITGEHAEWSAGFNSTVLTLATTTLYAGAALFWSHHVHREAEWASCCMMLEDLGQTASHTERMIMKESV